MTTDAYTRGKWRKKTGIRRTRTSGVLFLKYVFVSPLGIDGKRGTLYMGRRVTARLRGKIMTATDQSEET